MKLFLFALTLLVSSETYAQLDFVGTYEPIARLIYLDKGEPAIFVYDRPAAHIELYATDQTLISEFDIPYAWEGWGQYNLFHVSRQLFDCDSTNIEYLISRSDDANPSEAYVKVIRASGEELFSLSNHTFSNSDGLSTNPTIGPAMVEMEDGVLISFYEGAISGPANSVYKTCGRIPGPTSFYGGDDNPVGVIDGELDKSNFNLYPNPSADILNVDYELPDGIIKGTLAIINNVGQLIYEKPVGSYMNQIFVDVSAWSNGQYEVILRSDTGTQLSKSFIKVAR